MRKLSKLFTVLALVFSHVLCIITAWYYRSAICGVMHYGDSAPPEVAFILAVPWLLPVIICTVLAIIFKKKSKR